MLEMFAKTDDFIKIKVGLFPGLGELPMYLFIFRIISTQHSLSTVHYRLIYTVMFITAAYSALELIFNSTQYAIGTKSFINNLCTVQLF